MKITFGLLAACLGLCVAVTQINTASAQTTTKKTTTTNKGSGEAGKLKQFEDLAQTHERKALPKTDSNKKNAAPISTSRSNK